MMSFPVLLADIGGTNARFAVLSGSDGPVSPIVSSLVADHPNPSAAAKAALAGVGGPKPRSALLAVAGRVESPVVHLTNAGWVIDAARIGADLGLDHVLLVNDLSPAAAALLLLNEPESGKLARLGPALPRGPGPRLVVGPGTGLGAAALIPAGERHAIQATEAGHVEFGPCEECDFAFWPLLERAHGRVTTECLLSGPGLVRLYRALAQARNMTPVYEAPKDVVFAARTGRDPLASETLRFFARFLGRFAGDLALVFGATGGVYVAGGIVPRILDVLDTGDFRAAFERKAPFDAVVRRIPTFVITHAEPIMAGLAALAGAPERYFFEAQGWPAPAAAKPEARP